MKNLREGTPQLKERNFAIICLYALGNVTFRDLNIRLKEYRPGEVGYDLSHQRVFQLYQRTYTLIKKNPEEYLGELKDFIEANIGNNPSAKAEVYKYILQKVFKLKREIDAEVEIFRNSLSQNQVQGT